MSTETPLNARQWLLERHVDPEGMLSGYAVWTLLDVYARAVLAEAERALRERATGIVVDSGQQYYQRVGLFEAARPAGRNARRQMTASELEVLKELYEYIGPRDRGYKGAVPASTFAAMTEAEVDRWDFDLRHMAHKLAKMIARRMK